VIESALPLEVFAHGPPSFVSPGSRPSALFAKRSASGVFFDELMTLFVARTFFG
jgi:hypothetical protein